MGVKIVFLYSTLQEEIYVEVLEGYKIEGNVCQLREVYIFYQQMYQIYLIFRIYDVLIFCYSCMYIMKKAVVEIPDDRLGACAPVSRSLGLQIIYNRSSSMADSLPNYEFRVIPDTRKYLLAPPGVQQIVQAAPT